MPIFEYKCEDCSVVSEFLENANSKAKHECVKCGSKKMVKQFSTFSSRVSQGQPESNCHGCPSGQTCPNAQF